jgi:hypothetical protein
MEMARVLALLSQKPELVTTFPDWLFPPTAIDALKKMEGVALAEIAGRDSVAAVLAAVEERPITGVLPTVAYTGTEFGEWERTFATYRFVAERLRGHGIQVFDPLFLGAPRFWWLLCGRYIFTLFRRFGFYTPCLGCHLYLHALRIPLARLIGAPYIIAGERERHDGRIKINQVAPALDAYSTFVKTFSVELLLPLRSIHSGEEIERIIGQQWEEGGGQLECVLSKNYQDMDGFVDYDEAAIRRFFEEFAFPLAETVVRAYLEGEEPNYDALSRSPFPLSKEG